MEYQSPIDNWNNGPASTANSYLMLSSTQPSNLIQPTEIPESCSFPDNNSCRETSQLHPIEMVRAPNNLVDSRSELGGNLPTHLRTSRPLSRSTQQRSISRKYIQNYLADLLRRIESEEDLSGKDIAVIALGMSTSYEKIKATFSGGNTVQGTNNMFLDIRTENEAAASLTPTPGFSRVCRTTKGRINKSAPKTLSSSGKQRHPDAPPLVTDWIHPKNAEAAFTEAAKACIQDRDHCIAKMSADEIRKNREKKWDPEKPYSCTLGCGQTFKNPCEFRRHEACNRPKHAWLCNLGPTVDSTAGHRCSICGRLRSDCDPTEHKQKTPCNEKGFSFGHGTRHFRREDKMAEHFTKFHKGLSREKHRQSSRYTVDDNWERVCGFCGTNFTDFEEWANHVVEQFKKQRALVDWHDPWDGEVEPLKCESIGASSKPRSTRNDTRRSGKNDPGEEEHDDDETANGPGPSFPDRHRRDNNFGGDPDAGAGASSSNVSSTSFGYSLGGDAGNFGSKSQHPDCLSPGPCGYYYNLQTFDWFLHFQSVCGRSFSEESRRLKLLNFSDVDQIAQHLSRQRSSPLSIALRQYNKCVGSNSSQHAVTAVFRMQDQVFIFEAVPSTSIQRKLLGHGGSSTVEVARIPGHPQAYAMKSNRQGSMKLLKEARLLMSLRHIHLVQMQGMLMTAYSTVMLISPVAERSLKELLDDPVLLKEIRIENFGCLASVLDYIHGEGINHGDVKPGNILVKKQDNNTFTWLLTDFSASRRIDIGKVEFTPKYAAPEALNSGRSSTASDIFSLAATITHVLATILGDQDIKFLNCYSERLSEVVCWLQQLRLPSPHALRLHEWDVEPLQRLRAIPSKMNFAALSTLRLNGQHLDCIQKMLSNLQNSRPKASEVVKVFPAARCCRVRSGYNLRLKPRRGSKAEHRSPLYEPLSTDCCEIRLLRLLPCNGNTLSCILEVTSLDPGPAYEALSYTWGDPFDIVQISLNGRPFLISRNLHRALQGIQCGRHNRLLWVDAICINQMDVQERNSQVAMMNRIYRQAENVIVWLGGETDDDFLEMRRQVKKITRSVGCWHCMNKTGETCDEFAHGQNWNRLNQALSSRWWSRVWVIQEIALARHATIQCGDWAVPWKTFAVNARKSLGHHIGSHLHLTKNEHTIDDIVERLGMLSLVERLSTPQDDEIDLLELLRRTRRHKCTDPRDRIYAIFGLAPNTFKKLSLWPNYSQSHGQVLLRLAIALLEIGKTEVLTYGGTSSRKGDLPSWVPSWSWAGWAGWPDWTRMKPTLHLAKADRSIQASFDYPVGKSDPVLHVAGILLDEIETDCLPLEREVESVHSAVADYLQSSGKSPVTLKPYHIQSLFNVLWDAYLWESMIDTDISPLKSAPTRQIPQPVRPSFLTEKYSHWMGTFVTKRDFIGLGPRTLQHGDVVAIIYGASVPLILREVDEGTYTLIGGCYIDGIMNGEEVKCGGKNQTFKLR